MEKSFPSHAYIFQMLTCAGVILRVLYWRRISGPVSWCSICINGAVLNLMMITF
jgi:hypothetical protein